MKTIAAILLLLPALSGCAFGRAVFYARSELIKNASVIAIVDLSEPGKAQHAVEDWDPFDKREGATGERWAYSQQANARVERILKGSIPKEFILYGGESFICAECRLSKGRFLVFLTKDRDLWVGANWQFSLRPIRDNEVEWYVSEEQRFPMKFQKLESAITQIEWALATEIKANKSP